MTPRFILGSPLVALALPMSALALSVGDTTSTDTNEIRAKGLHGKKIDFDGLTF